MKMQTNKTERHRSGQPGNDNARKTGAYAEYRAAAGERNAFIRFCRATRQQYLAESRSAEDCEQNGVMEN